jgi:hypothetical protein
VCQEETILGEIGGGEMGWNPWSKGMLESNTLFSHAVFFY